MNTKNTKNTNNTKKTNKTKKTKNINKTRNYIKIQQLQYGGLITRAQIQQTIQIQQQNTPSLSITYNNNKNPITSGQLLNREECSLQPNIILSNIDDTHTYLIIMSDPDAPEGNLLPNKNHRYIHWIYTQKGTNINSNINTNNNINTNITEIQAYIKPTPPKGIHRYIFTLYDMKDTYIMTKIIQKIKTLKNSNNINDINNNNKIFSFLYKYKIGKEVYYKVKAGY